MTASSALIFQDLTALVLLSRTPGIRKRGLDDFFGPHRSPTEILKRIQSGEHPVWKNSLETTLKKFDPEKEIKRTEDLGIVLLPFSDPRYPSLLKEISDPPLLLYVKGNFLESDDAAVAIVGSRHAGLYGQEQAKRFARRLTEWGLTIVSGFARGIDRASHEACLEISYGRTLAVLGSGLDVVYPKEHRALYEEISERGALISEFALGTPPLAENFPKRNRIIAGLSLGVLVIEAHSRSGSLITAHLAAEEGREVFALPGRVDQLGSRGTHRLIKEGAALLESPEEVLETLFPQLWPLVSAPASSSTASDQETEFLGVFDEFPLTSDEAARLGGLSFSAAASLLTGLELKGRLRKRRDGRYERIQEARKGFETQGKAKLY